MIVIRLARGGRNKKPFYRVVVADKRFPRDGRFIERLGYYNPVFNLAGDQDLRLDIERIDYWLGQGAQTSARVKQLIKRHRKAQPVATAAAAKAAPKTATKAAPKTAAKAAEKKPTAKAAAKKPAAKKK